MSSKKTAITVAITTVALTLGSVGIATASGSKASVKSKTTISSTAVKAGTTGGLNLGTPGMGMHNDELASVLAALVTKGTLTQAQVDAINAALAAARAANVPPANPERTAIESLITSTLGIDAATLEKRLTAGDSLATIAGAKTGALISALVAAETKEIDAAVTAGRLTAAQATTLKSGLTTQVTAMVNATGGFGRGRGGMMGGGRGNDHDGGPMGAGPMGGGMGGGTTPLSITPSA
jgi:hypothetical protein